MPPESPTWCRRWATGRTPRRAAAAARGSGSPASRPATVTAAGCGFPPARCAWSPTGGTSPCRWSGGCGPRRTPGGLSGWSPRDGRCGVDLGIGQEWAVVAHGDGSIERIAHPAPWAELAAQQRRVARQLSRRIVGSRGYRHAKAKRAGLDRRAANLRSEAIHTLTTHLARRYGTVVVEDLDVAAMGRGMGRRAFRRSVHQAGIGRVRLALA